MQTIDIPPGHHIGSAAERLVRAAPARAIFNDLEIVAQPGDTADAIVHRYHEAHEERRARKSASEDRLTIAERVVSDLWTLIGMASAGYRDGEAAEWSMIHNQVAEMVRRMRVGAKR